MKDITNFFLLCSGANLELLGQCKTERSKYAGLGATIFFTGVFAFMSASFALYTVFDNVLMAISLGVVWGLMIFNLDRYIVSGMRKEGRPVKEMINALPRIILAVLISVVIAKPLELRIFDKEIQPELSIMEQQVYAQQENETRKRFAATDSALRLEVNVLNTELQSKAQKRDELRRIAQEEADGTGGSRKKNLGPIYKVKKADADRADAELAELTGSHKQKIQELDNRIARNDSLQRTALAALQLTRRDGLAARTEALNRIKDKSEPIKWAGLFIMLLIIALETSPVFVKLIANRGPYDNLLAAEEFRFRTKEIEDVSIASAETRNKTSNWPPQENEFANSRLDESLKSS